jgi:Xaa-Pro aminopeptidase
VRQGSASPEAARLGGWHHICYLGITAMHEPALAAPAQWPTGRVIRPGDVVTCEISAAAAPEYPGQILRTFTVGAPPTGLYRDLHSAAVAAFDAVARTLIPGARARDLAAAATVIGQAGFSTIDDLVHGFGGGYLPPVVPGPDRPLPAPDFTLAAGMTVVVQPNVVTRDGHAGVQTGELLLVTEQGPQRRTPTRRACSRPDDPHYHGSHAVGDPEGTPPSGTCASS